MIRGTAPVLACGAEVERVEHARARVVQEVRKVGVGLPPPEGCDCACVHARACVRACVRLRACVHAREGVRACMRVRVSVHARAGV